MFRFKKILGFTLSLFWLTYYFKKELIDFCNDKVGLWGWHMLKKAQDKVCLTLTTKKKKLVKMAVYSIIFIRYVSKTPSRSYSTIR